MEGEVEEGFKIPLWKERISKVTQILTENNVESLIDFGCGEGKCLQLVRYNTMLKRVIGVDIVPQCLSKAKFEIEPLMTDFLQKRRFPLTIELYQGSVGSADLRFKGFDALIFIEVIEHLDSSVLYQCPKVIFGILNPKLVIISTPNSEFDIHFSEDHHERMRHNDHRFEWTRQEFMDWCEKVCVKYGYSVKYDGVGEPSEYKDVGYCTQMAIFKKEKDVDEKEKDLNNFLPFPVYPHKYCSLWTNHPLEQKEPEIVEYNFFHKVEYPYVDTDIDQELEELVMYNFKNQCKNELNEYDFSIPVTFDELYNNSRIQNLCQTKEVFRNFLQSSKHFVLLEDETIKPKVEIQIEEEEEEEEDNEWDETKSNVIYTEYSTEHSGTECW